MKIAIVGPCAAGKTTLVSKLCAIGYDAHDVAQEHSDVPTMWREITQPDVLIYLDVSLEALNERLRVNWEAIYFGRLVSRLSDAREHAHFLLNTSGLSETQVWQRVTAYLEAMGVNPPSVTK